MPVTVVTSGQSGSFCPVGPLPPSRLYYAQSPPGVQNLSAFDADQSFIIDQTPGPAPKWRITYSHTLGFFGTALAEPVVGEGEIRFVFEAVRPTFPPCIREMKVTWVLEWYAVDALLRNYLDERLSLLGPILSFVDLFANWLGFGNRVVSPPSQFDFPNHVRGLAYKAGSQIGPRAFPQITTFVWGGYP